MLRIWRWLFPKPPTREQCAEALLREAAALGNRLRSYLKGET
jgi:hypothetical protein